MAFRDSKLGNRMKTIGHLIAGVVIILHATGELEKGEYQFGIPYLAFGVIFVLLAMIHSKLERRYPSISAIFFFIEGTVLFITGWRYIHEGKEYLQYFSFLSGILYFIAGIAFLRKKRNVSTIKH